MRIGILTFHKAYNCGAMLQAWALQTVLERMGHMVSFPSCNSVGYYELKYYAQTILSGKKGFAWVRSLLGRLWLDLRFDNDHPKRMDGYNRFRRKYLHEANVTTMEFEKHYDLIVVGSDQVWSDIHSVEDAPLFFGENDFSSLPYIAYAASYGDKKLVGDRLARVISCLNRYSAISVREQLVKDQLQCHYNNPIQVVLDPTLLLTADTYKMLCGKKVSGEYLYCYTLVATRFVIDTVMAASKALHLKPIVSAVYKTEDSVIDDIVEYAVSPDRMIAYVRNSTCVVASSFHGTALSVIHGKPFVSIREQVDECESRPASLLWQIGELQRLVTPMTSHDKICDLLKMPLSKLSTSKLEELRRGSLAWLEDKIK